MSVHVSDHALLRYFERVGGVDVEAVRRALAASLTRAADRAQEIQPGVYAIKSADAHFVMRNRVVVTVFHKNHIPDLNP